MWLPSLMGTRLASAVPVRSVRHNGHPEPLLMKCCSCALMPNMRRHVRQGNDLEITHPRSKATAVPHDERRWGRLVHRQRLTIRLFGNANEVASEAGVVDWLKGLMKQLVVNKFCNFPDTSKCHGLRPRPGMDLLAATHTNV